jgi:hypothetical protein
MENRSIQDFGGAGFQLGTCREQVTAMTRPLLKSSQGRQLPFSFDGGFGGLETDFAVSAVTEGLVHGTSAAAE